MGTANFKGLGSVLKFMVMTDLSKDSNGNYKRPAAFDANALILEETTTSDANISHDEQQAEEDSPVYASPAAGSGPRWKDPEPGAGGWGFTFSGNVQPVEAERAAMEALRSAQADRKIIWLERTMNTETVPEGGAGYLASGNFPVPVDGIVTYSFTFTGKKAHFLDTSAATVAS